MGRVTCYHKKSDSSYEMERITFFMEVMELKFSVHPEFVHKWKWPLQFR